MSRRRCSLSGVLRRPDQGPQHEWAGGEEEQGRDEKRHDAPTGVGTRETTGWIAARGAPALPRSTPMMMIAPPAQIQLTRGLMKTRKDADPSPFVPDSTT